MPATSIRSGFKTFVIAGVLGFPLIGTGCATLNPTGQGAAVGAGVGAAAGAVIGNQTGSTSRGAILGAVIGGTAGALIGRRMDDTAEEIQADVPGASVERIGEGILVVFDSGILFDFDSSTLRPAARENLRRLAENLRDDADTELLVVGHTDDVGNDDYNQRLSERRAAAASDYLMENGVRPSRVRTSGRGEMEPVQSNASEAGRQANRRVEIAIFASDEYRSRVGR